MSDGQKVPDKANTGSYPLARILNQKLPLFRLLEISVSQFHGNICKNTKQNEMTYKLVNIQIAGNVNHMAMNGI